MNHVLEMWEKLNEMKKLVRQGAQRKQWRWYDIHVSLRWVLVLLPSSSNKLLAQWQGTCQVVKRCGKVPYVDNA